MKEFEQWNGFEGRLWKEEVNVRDFIQNNYTQYDGDEEFLLNRQMQQTVCGANCRSCRKQSVQKTAFWTWRQKLLLP